ncbi:mucin-2-like isoform X2 [Uranotaenia lowii]|nr:mucin-2-like isoform X2 [Uranotaenia lowii]XP_055598756.1 mucin-2-like isoform X2 [Uranotaenia lowii]XP_055598757.1 mucin-2-like isoform X2 [Uranotaenia lowii]XP_055598758.1 mucin-2-like isoform X2 [Uranotaenia lowii]XP_055598759.1 mucin-2-like isoform X2 [Uranotaenia lowii]XP_055598760.1 mucin-2-like isoform X2 [Uranotaenia lowii]XP_055598761.1 mucin-2-like isoform X2 [Uranotaenia lowii]
MASLTLILLSYSVCMFTLARALPITSKPLDNSPDHLTWEASWLSGDSRLAGSGGKAKKITPKSIFIAPQLNGYNGSLCPPDSKIDYTGKCIQVVNINTADILVTKLQSILGNGGALPGGDADYDYDYDPSGPFQVNLPLSIDLPGESPIQPAKQVDPIYEAAILEVPSTTTVRVLETTTSQSSTPKEQPTFLSHTRKHIMDQAAAETHTDISFIAFESLPNGTVSTQLEVDGANGTIIQNIVLSSTDAAPTTSTTVDSESPSSVSTTTLTSTSADIPTSTMVSTTTEELGTSTTEWNFPTEDRTITPGTTTTEVLSTTMEMKSTMSSAYATTTQQIANDTPDNEFSSLKTELAEDLLILGTSSTATTELPSTDVSELNADLYSTASSTIEFQVTSTTFDPTESTSTVEPPTTKVLFQAMPARRNRPSPKPVQIVTPVRTKWYSPPGATPPPFVIASYTQQERTTRATPETTTAATIRATDYTSLSFTNDTENDKRNQELIHRQELKDNLRETMDSNNRFVYHHLPVPSASIVPAPAKPTTVPEHNYIDQLRKINEIVAENKNRHHQAAMASNSRVRFPTRDEDQSPAATNSQVVRFPGSVSSRYSQQTNRLPDIFPKKSADTTTQRPPFWWLPTGWEVDQTGQKPMLLRFWSRMPLVRDESLTTGSGSSSSTSSGSPPDYSSTNRWKHSSRASSNTSPSHSTTSRRGNSRSPSENFYKEVSSQDVYKVLNMRQLKHNR